MRNIEIILSNHTVVIHEDGVKTKQFDYEDIEQVLLTSDPDIIEFQVCGIFYPLDAMQVLTINGHSFSHTYLRNAVFGILTYTPYSLKTVSDLLNIEEVPNLRAAFDELFDETLDDGTVTWSSAEW